MLDSAHNVRKEQKDVKRLEKKLKRGKMTTDNIVQKERQKKATRQRQTALNGKRIYDLWEGMKNKK